MAIHPGHKITVQLHIELTCRPEWEVVVGKQNIKLHFQGEQKHNKATAALHVLNIPNNVHS